MVIRPDKNNMAGILLVSSELIYEDIWRHKKDIHIEITFQNYLDFIETNRNLLQFLSIGSHEDLLDRYLKGDEQAKYLLYPYFVRDVLLAYVAEIFLAYMKRKEFPRFKYIPDTEYRKMKGSRLPNAAQLFETGEKILYQRNFKNEITSLQYTKQLDICKMAIGYSVHTEMHPRDFFWVLY